MKIVSHVTINKPIKEVWEFYDNPDNLSKWLTGFKRYEHTSGEFGKPGSRGLHHYEEKGREFVMEEELLELIPEKSMKGYLRHKTMESTLSNQFEEVDDQTTAITCEIDVTFKTFPFKILGPFMKREFQRRQDNDFNTLKEILEGKEEET